MTVLELEEKGENLLKRSLRTGHGSQGEAPVQFSYGKGEDRSQHIEERVRKTRGTCKEGSPLSQTARTRRVSEGRVKEFSLKEVKQLPLSVAIKGRRTRHKAQRLSTLRGTTGCEERGRKKSKRSLIFSSEKRKRSLGSGSWFKGGLSGKGSERLLRSGFVGGLRKTSRSRPRREVEKKI